MSLPKSYRNAILDPVWKSVMDEEITALRANETWELNYGNKTLVVDGFILSNFSLMDLSSSLSTFYSHYFISCDDEAKAFVSISY